ncbi:cell division protein FtsA [Patescibacteria group bacterium]|nr:cell division protein FtsA [Patescibacteria group bacterium]MBU1935380.1 cell division protein FtsA [Patescibacteria group bacterium]
MPKEQIIASLDVGSSKIRTVIALLEEDKKMPNIIGVGVAPSTGMRKGNIIDVDEAISNISAALEDAERMSGAPIHHVFVGINGNHVESFDSKGVIAISHAGSEIIEDDINRVLEAAQAVNMPSNRRILRIIPKSFSVDDQRGIKNPIGMIGVRLEVDAHIITGQSTIVKNVEKAVHQAGVDIDDIVPASLAAAEAVLSRRQKELGVVVIDVGCGSTSISVFEEGATLHTASLPVGGESVTNDVAIGLRTSIDTADKIKIEYGTTSPDEVNDRETIDLSLISKIDNQKVSKKHLAEIIQARYHEIFVMVKDELRAIGRDGMLPSGAILTGAGVKMPGCLDLAREVLGLPVQIGFPTEVEGVVDKIDDPAYATAIGLVVWGSKYEGRSYSLASVDFKKFFGNMKGWVKNLLP